MASTRRFMGLRGNRLKAAMLCLIVIPSCLLFGYNNGSTGGILTLQAFVTQFPQIDTVNPTGTQLAHNSLIQGVVTGIYDLGAIVGSLSCIVYSERIGRLRTIFIGLVLAIIALAIESSAYSLAQLIVGRIVVGISVGIISAAVPVWQSECSSTAHRGSFVIMEGLAISAGITISEWISFGFYFATTNSANWRVPLVFPVVFALFAIPFLFVMPESPRWLARVNRLVEARQVLAALVDQDEHSEDVNKEMAAIELSLTEIRGSLKDLTKNGKQRVLNRTLLAMTVQLFQQMCGIAALVFYTNTVFLNLGFKGTESRILAACLTTFQTCSSVIPLFVIDRFGRRKLFMFSAAGMCVCMAVVAGTANSSNPGVAGVAVAFIYLFDFFEPIGFLGQTFLYATEVAPLKLRVPITAIANATQWLFQFVVAQVTPPGAANLGTKYYIIYAVINFFIVPIVYFFFPETTNRSLEEMDNVFGQAQGYFDVVGIAKRLPRNGGIDAEQQLEQLAVNENAYTPEFSKPAHQHEEVVKQN